MAEVATNLLFRSDEVNAPPILTGLHHRYCPYQSDVYTSDYLHILSSLLP